MVMFNHHSDHNEESHREEKDCKDMFRDFFFVEKIRNRNLRMGSLFGVLLVGTTNEAIGYEKENRYNHCTDCNG